MGPRKHPPSTSSLAPRPPAPAPGWGAPTNAIPATIPCPACDAPMAVAELWDGREPAVAIVYLEAGCSCGLRLAAVGVDRTGDLHGAARVALEDLRALYRTKQRSATKGT